MTSQAINRSVHRELKDVHPGLGDANAAGDSIVKSQPERRTGHHRSHSRAHVALKCTAAALHAAPLRNHQRGEAFYLLSIL